MTPIRIQRKRKKGWKMPANTIYVGRPTIRGNPFRIGERVPGLEQTYYSVQDVVSLFEQELDIIIMNLGMTREEFLEPLRGKNLACFCPLDQPCHADVLLRLANQPLEVSQ